MSKGQDKAKARPVAVIIGEIRARRDSLPADARVRLTDADLARIEGHLQPLEHGDGVVTRVGYASEDPHYPMNTWPLPLCTECQVPIVQCGHPWETHKVREPGY